MNTAVINVKVDADLKKQAQAVVEELGLTLSSFINVSLKQLTRTRSLQLDLREEPNEHMIAALKESRKDIKAGRVSPSFKDARSAIKWLHSSKRTWK